MVRSAWTAERLAVISWALFLVLAVSGAFVAADAPLGPVALIASVVAVVFAYRFPYATLYVAIGLTPFLGLMLSLPTGVLVIGRRAFGGSIDVSAAEVVLLFALLGWAGKLLVLWKRRRAEEWKPRLPMALPSIGLVFAHIASIWSPFEPDYVQVLKFSMRPVLFDLIAFVALPVNYLRSRKRLVAALGVFGVVATLAALDGVLAMFFLAEPGHLLGRARPLSVFGVSVLGENQNELAEFLVTTAPMTLALAWFMRERRHARVWAMAGALQVLVALLTFTRTAWIVVAVQAVCLAFGPFRRAIRRRLAFVSVSAVLFLPLLFTMLSYSASYAAQSSGSTRLMLTEIAFNIFRTSPVFGYGAGTFYDRVGSTRVFLVEYGAPLDSHGWVQKIAAETGTIGLLALACFLLAFARQCVQGRNMLRLEHSKQAAALFIASAWGGILYQFFNTDYWTGKMWLPIGLALAGLAVLARLEQAPDGSREVASRDILET